MSDKKYIQAVGRRKTSVARVRIYEGDKGFTVNEKPLADYFKTATLQKNILSPFAIAGLENKFAVTVVTKGGGVSSQADAVRHGIARALISYDRELRSKLKAEGFLKRDPREKERRKFGLKKARKSPQWSKR